MTRAESLAFSIARSCPNRTPRDRFAFRFCAMVFSFSIAGAAVDEDRGVARPSGAGRMEETVIVSDSLVMRSGRKRNYFYFENEVLVEGANLVVKCDRLEIVALREAALDQSDAKIGEFGTIQRITASGNVVILQAGRRAEAGRAEVLPGEGKVVLTDSPRVVDGQGEVRGWRITLLKDEKRAVVESDPDGGGQRSTVRLSKLPDLGFESEDTDNN